MPATSVRLNGRSTIGERAVARRVDRGCLDGVWRHGLACLAANTAKPVLQSSSDGGRTGRVHLAIRRDDDDRERRELWCEVLRQLYG
jgi:hypothetical protein